MTSRAWSKVGKRRLARAALVVGMTWSAFLWMPLGGAVAGAAHVPVRVRIVVNGQPAATSSDAHPVRLDPRSTARVHVVLTAVSSEVRVSTVRFEGDVMALPLFSYDSTVDFVVPAGATRSFTFEISLTGIGNEATGLVDATFTLLSPSGAPLVSQGAVTDVNGSIVSLYGLFGLAVLLLTVSSLLFGLLAMARHQLPQNRWMRALRFLVPGFGVGLVLIFTMSSLGVFDPGTGHWLPLLIIPSAIGLAGGYLTPAPDEEEFDDYDPDVLIAQIMIVDEDPLEEQPAREPEFAYSGVVRPTGLSAASTESSGGRDGRATAGPPPESRASADPPWSSSDSRATVAPAAGIPEPDGRATAAPAPDADAPAEDDHRSSG